MSELRKKIIDEVSEVFYKIDENEVDHLIKMILRAKRIFIYACGREGLMLKAFGMRLHHLGLEVHVVGDITAPAIEEGDLMLAVCGPGYVSTVITIVDIAKKVNAYVAAMTANKDGDIAKYCDHIINIPAQTMLIDADEVKSIQPMGSIFEQAQLLIEEYMVLKIAEQLQCNEADMRKRHANLE